jgi:hypothetical protein
MDEWMDGRMLWFWLIDFMMELIDELEIFFGPGFLSRYEVPTAWNRNEGQERKG